MSRLLLSLAVVFLLSSVAPVQAMTQHVWMLVSPDKGQTFAYGSLQWKQWVAYGPDNAKHLALKLTYTNDPYVDRSNPRQTDYFTFEFPSVKLGPDKKTFYFATGDGRHIKVAHRVSEFLGSEIKLMPSTTLIIDKPHGTLKVSIVIEDKFIRKDLSQGQNDSN